MGNSALENVCIIIITFCVCVHVCVCVCVCVCMCACVIASNQAFACLLIKMNLS